VAKERDGGKGRARGKGDGGAREGEVGGDLQPRASATAPYLVFTARTQLLMAEAAFLFRLVKQALDRISRCSLA